MKAITAILLIFLAQCTYLYAMPNPEPFSFDLSHSCVFGDKSISVIQYNSHYPEGKNVGIEECCDDLDPSSQVVFVVHGFISSTNASSFQEMISKLIQKGYTVFALNWSDAACTNGIPVVRLAEYPSAVKNTREIGVLMANYTTILIEKSNISIENITFIGHSLGAHVCGFAAKKMQESNFTISKIIACDPAAPLFGFNKCSDRLCNSDAKRLIAIHTSTLGMSKPIGCLDLMFGKIQPGCSSIDVSCSHSKSVDYATTMMVKNDCGFLGTPIKNNSIFKKAPERPTTDTKDCIIVDNNILDSPIEGQYDMFVEKKEPYCIKNVRNNFKCQQQQ